MLRVEEIVIPREEHNWRRKQEKESQLQIAALIPHIQGIWQCSKEHPPGKGGTICAFTQVHNLQKGCTSIPPKPQWA